MRLLSEEKVKSSQYNTVIKRAIKSLEEGKYQDALSQSDSALTVRPDSKEAQRIHEEASRAIDKLQKVNEFMTRADLFKAQNSYEEAIGELDKALSLDDTCEEAQTKKRELMQLQAEHISKLHELKAQLKEAQNANEYDTAINICEKLMDLDSVNLRKWSELSQEIKRIKEKRAETYSQLSRLLKDIDTSAWKEDWQSVVDFCQQYIAIEKDDDILLKLQQGKAKLEAEQKKQTFQKGVNAVKALMVDKKWSSAKDRLKELQLEYPEKNDVFKELWKKVFDGEEKEQSGNNNNKDGACNRPSIGFRKDNSMKQLQDDDFFDVPIKEKNKKVAVKESGRKTNSENQDDDFFNDTFAKNKKGETSQQSSKKNADDFFDMGTSDVLSQQKQLTNDDFNF